MHETLSAVGVPDRAAGSTNRTGAAARARRQTPSLMQSAGVLASLDTIAAVTALLAVLVNISVQRTASIEGFLSARITVKNILLLIALAVMWPVIFHAFRLYETRHRGRVEEGLRLLAAVTLGSVLALMFPLSSVSGSVKVTDVGHFWLAALGLCLLVRVGWHSVFALRTRHAQRTIIVGSGPMARKVHGQLMSAAQQYEFVGFVDDPFGDVSVTQLDGTVIGTLESLEQFLMRQVIDEVIIALPIKSRYEQIQYAIDVCELAGVRARYGADLFRSNVALPRFDAFEGGTFVAMHVTPDGYRMAIKRGIDIVGSIVGLILLSPLMLLVAAAIKLTSRGPVFYVQNRCGYGKRPLRMLKFRSMLADADKQQHRYEHINEATGPVFKIRNDPRVTPIGRILRKTSIDELPQLWNVLRGDMSLVGPRPLPWRDVERITRPADMRRFSMRPGLTCLWQVEGRSTLGFDRWVELDLQYIDNWSLTLDFLILLRTLPAVVSGRGAT
jgi:exopolysaccharide biosynthesis polyprenyl glycosylphosphotransferase